MTKQPLIPGLPDDLGLNCLLRLNYPQFLSGASVSKSWSSELRHPDFLRLRRLSSTSQTLFLFTTHSVPRGSTITTFEPATATWTRLPGSDTLTLPFFCRLASVGSDLVLLGGLDPMTWQASNSVYIFSFLTGKWRRGSDIPGPARAFFGCDSDRVRTVFVAGGHDREKKALRSCLAYDVVDDKWVSLADMVKERDECQVIFLRGRVHVIGGYCTEEQGRFGRSAEVFNAATWEWDPVEEYLDNAVCPRNMVAASDGAVYMCRSGEVAERVKDVWQFVTGLPADVAKTEYVAEWEGKLLVIGSAVEGDAKKKKKNVYVVDLKKPAEWRQLGTPTECSGVVHCGCCVEI